MMPARKEDYIDLFFKAYSTQDLFLRFTNEEREAQKYTLEVILVEAKGIIKTYVFLNISLILHCYKKQNDQ